jgi:hypothetical protein
METTETETTQVILNLQELQVRDLVASAWHRTESPPTAATLAEWQGQPEVRTHYREAARTLIEILEQAGIDLRVTRQRKFAEALEHLRTIPARPAYDDSEFEIATPEASG